jgi:hypothetical protein
MNITRTGVVLTFLALLAVQLLNAGESTSFDGVWKLNLEKSRISPYNLSIEKVEGGKIRFGDLLAVLNATEPPAPEDKTNVVFVASSDSETCKVTFLKNGKLVSITTFSSHGDKAVSKLKFRETEGKTFEQTTKFERVSGGPGFLGEWRSSDAAEDLPKTLKIAGGPSSGISLEFSEEHVSFTGMFDGKDYPMKPPNSEVMQMMSFERVGDKAFRTSRKLQGGEVFSTDVFTLSEDGTILTDTKAAEGRKTSNLVYEKK